MASHEIGSLASAGQENSWRFLGQSLEITELGEGKELSRDVMPHYKAAIFFSGKDLCILEISDILERTTDSNRKLATLP